MIIVTYGFKGFNNIFSMYYYSREAANAAILYACENDGLYLVSMVVIDQ